MVPDDPSVSVVLPTYNRATPLRKAIQSVLDQTYTDFELLIVDDASTDNTSEVVAEFDDERISYLSHEVNRGVSAARNTGIKRAQGAIVAFQDSDDEWMPEKLQRQMETFAHAPDDVGVVYTGMWRTVDGEKRYLPYSGVDHKQGDIRPSILRNNFISTQMAAVRCECFEQVGSFDESLAALVDWELWIRISERYRFRLIDEPLVKAVVQSDSISEHRSRIVNAREHIVDKHYDSFDQNSLANHLFYIGHGSMKLGQANKGRQYLKRAAFTQPTLVHIGAWLLSFFRSWVYATVYQAIKSVSQRLS